MTIPGTVCCDRIKDAEKARCACGWSQPVRSQREAKRRFHWHLRWVKASLWMSEPRSTGCIHAAVTCPVCTAVGL